MIYKHYIRLNHKFTDFIFNNLIKYSEKIYEYSSNKKNSILKQRLKDTINYTSLYHSIDDYNDIKWKIINEGSIQYQFRINKNLIKK